MRKANSLIIYSVSSKLLLPLVKFILPFVGAMLQRHSILVIFAENLNKEMV